VQAAKLGVWSIKIRPERDDDCQNIKKGSGDRNTQRTVGGRLPQDGHPVNGENTKRREHACKREGRVSRNGEQDSKEVGNDEANNRIRKRKKTPGRPPGIRSRGKRSR